MKMRWAALAVSLSCLLMNTTARAQDCAAGYGSPRLIGSNAHLSFRPRAEANDPTFNYIMPRFRVEIGTSPVVDVIPPPAWQRFFKSIAGTDSSAVALIANLSNKGQIPLLIVDKSGNTGSSKLGLSVALLPVFVVPKDAMNFKLSFKKSTSYDTNLAEAMSVGLGIISPLVGGVPAVLLSPAAVTGTKVIDGLIDKTFTTMVDQEWGYDLTTNELKLYDCARIVIYDAPISASNKAVVAQVTLELPAVKTILAPPPPEGAPIAWPAKHLILNNQIGGRTIKEILQQGNVGEVMGGLSQKKDDTSYYKEGCKIVRDAVHKLGLNAADTLAVLAAAIGTTKPTAEALSECPDADERKEMAKFGISITDKDKDIAWSSIYNPFLKDVASTSFKGSKSFDGLIEGDTLVVKQDIAVLSNFPVDDTGKHLSISELDELFKKGVVSGFQDYEYKGNGVTFIKGLTINGKKCQARIIVGGDYTDDGKFKPLLREVRFIKVTL